MSERSDAATEMNRRQPSDDEALVKQSCAPGGLPTHKLLDALAVVRGFANWQSYLRSMKNPAAVVALHPHCSYKGCARVPWLAGKSSLCIMHHFGLSERLAAAAKDQAERCWPVYPPPSANIFVGPPVPPGFCRVRYCEACGTLLELGRQQGCTKYCLQCRPDEYRRLAREYYQRGHARNQSDKQKKRQDVALARRYVLQIVEWFAGSCQKLADMAKMIEERRLGKSWQQLGDEHGVSASTLQQRVSKYAHRQPPTDK